MDDVIITYRDILSVWLVFMMDKQNNNKTKQPSIIFAVKQICNKNKMAMCFFMTHCQTNIYKIVLCIGLYDIQK